MAVDTSQIPSGYSVLPIDYAGTFDFFDYYEGIIDIDGVSYYLLNYPDVIPEGGNGYADFYDEELGDPGITINPSQGHAGG